MAVRNGIGQLDEAMLPLLRLMNWKYVPLNGYLPSEEVDKRKSATKKKKINLNGNFFSLVKHIQSQEL